MSKAKEAARNSGAKRPPAKDKTVMSRGAKTKNSPSEGKVSKMPSSKKQARPKAKHDLGQLSLREEYTLACHPNLRVHQYYIDRLGNIYHKNARNKYVEISPKGKKRPMVRLRIPAEHDNSTKSPSFYVDELIASTFVEGFDSRTYHIFHKDGDLYNCALSNLVVVCDFSELQKLEIARLEILNPDVTYTTVKNLHEYRTFSQYLVSDSARILNLKTREPVNCTDNAQGYLCANLFCDLSSDAGSSRQLCYRLCNIVLQSFKGRRPEDYKVGHINGFKHDDSLKNLGFFPFVDSRTGKEAEEVWQNIETLPWRNEKFTGYQVSNLGRIRSTNGHKLYTHENEKGYPLATMECTGPNGERKRVKIHISRLVAVAFLQGYDTSWRGRVRRLNGDRRDIRAINLEWETRATIIAPRTSRRVLATLKDNPEAPKEFPSMKQAMKALRIKITPEKFVEGLDKKVMWGGARQTATVRVF